MSRRPSDFEITQIKPEIRILIPLDEYKELLIIKGRYQELKDANGTLTLVKMTENKKEK